MRTVDVEVVELEIGVVDQVDGAATGQAGGEATIRSATKTERPD